MKRDIINEKKRSSAIQPTIGFSLTLCFMIFFVIFDVRDFGVEVNKGIETIMFWVIRVMFILLIPIFIFLIVKCVKQLIQGELLFRVSDESIFIKINDKQIYDISYKDIEKVTYKIYSNEQQYIIFIFLKDPLKYLDEKQMIRINKARESNPIFGDIGIPSLFTNEKLDVVLEAINYYMKKICSINFYYV